MNSNLFRKKSVERIVSPEQLDDYLHVTTPAVWVVLIAIVFLLAGFLFWCSVTVVASYIDGEAEVQNGVLTITFDEEERADHITAGMPVTVGELTTQVLSMGTDENGGAIAIARLNIPDGRYDVRVGYRSTQLLDLLFN